MLTGCFLTTAACDYAGLADDCVELETLRRFRDSYMSETEARRRNVQAYYATAPAIVAWLGRASDRDAILQKLLADYVRPSVRAVDAGLPAQAEHIYTEMMEWLGVVASTPIELAADRNLWRPVVTTDADRVTNMP
jgi:phosphodiesterase/alkaline phosphatase D-like protein